MQLTINTFKAAILEKGGFVEPAFDKEVSFQCEKKYDHFLVEVFNASPEKLIELKQKYEWIEEKEIEVPDPEV